MLWTWWADTYPDTIDFGLYLFVCIPALGLLKGPNLAAAVAVLVNLLLVKGYEQMTGGYAVVDNFYVIADMLCVGVLSLVLLHYHSNGQFSSTAVYISSIFWLCVSVDSIKMMGVGLDATTCWWAVRLLNYSQLILIGGASVGGRGKRNRRPGAFLRFDRSGSIPASARVRGSGR